MSKKAKPDNERLRVLISYHYFKNTDLDQMMAQYFTEPYPEVFLDSGAWSAFTQGVEIKLADYCQFVDRFKHLFTVVCNLDDMLDPEQTWKNQQDMEDRGFTPLPVFHTGEPWQVLERYIDRYAYIGVGKIIPYTQTPRVIVPWVIRCFKLAEGKAVFHGLGVTNWLLLRLFPWYSVDSSSWGSGFRFGTVPIWDPTKANFTKVKLGDKVAWQRVAPLVEALGYDWQDFAYRERNDRAKVCAVAALSYRKAEQWLRRRHGPITLPDHPQGLRLYLADGAAENLGYADYGLKLYLASVETDLQHLAAGLANRPAKVRMGIKYT